MNQENQQNQRNKRNKRKDQKPRIQKNQKQQPKKFKTKTKKNQNKKNEFIFGNYSRYYGYRLVNQEKDPRINILPSKLFEGKNCLDIGCNSGFLTLKIAYNYNVKSMVGIDIDNSLINKAKIRNRKKKEKIKNKFIQEKIKEKLKTEYGFTKVPLSFLVNKDLIEMIEEDEKKKMIENEEIQMPNIEFRQENFLDNLEIKEKFEVILCLSVTKWIHLNWGDLGIKKMFRKIYDSLEVNGLFILEPQPLKSYIKRKKMNSKFAHHFKRMKLPPEEFETFLTKEMGFILKSKLDVPHPSTGFSRNIYIYEKSKELKELQELQQESKELKELKELQEELQESKDSKELKELQELQELQQESKELKDLKEELKDLKEELKDFKDLKEQLKDFKDLKEQLK
ncbi:7sk snRNA methylphosphate capping enzyme [Anaeramoeba ignava]|uniref:RNA methyltransferase n=1 Tax=Anaeramoeba ignava TaxID=1746090 RepID=A0A9Q0LHX2_ANAIG|nr:7sk snRNA methylphosphate capping enzyme [Anaeramoeba ignava]